MSSKNAKITKEIIAIFFAVFAFCCAAAFAEHMIAGECLSLLAGVSLASGFVSLGFFSYRV